VVGSRRMRAALRGKAPGMAAEREFWDAGHEWVAGLDEVGRGAWAGPLTVAAVVPDRHRRITGVRDSKMLNEDEREHLYERITNWAVFATLVCMAVPDGKALESTSRPQTLLSSTGAAGPTTRNSNRPCVTSVTVVSESPTD